MPIAKGIVMSETALLRLMTWLSPSFPIGGFSYSHGLEYAVEQGAVQDAASLKDWLEDILTHGTGRTDGILFAASWRAAAAGDDDALKEIAELGFAFVPSTELALETRAQGAAFTRALLAIWAAPTLARLNGAVQGRLTYPLAVGTACADQGIDLVTGLSAYLHSFIANGVSAGVRLIPLGQTDGLGVIAALEKPIRAQAEAAAASDLEDLASATPFADICSMRHETQYTRLFRS